MLNLSFLERNPAKTNNIRLEELVRARVGDFQLGHCSKQCVLEMATCTDATRSPIESRVSDSDY